MIIGIGNDLVEIERFEKLVQKEEFTKRYFTADEITMARGRPAFFAANFSVKEAVSKVFGTGIRGFSLDEIEVLRDDRGKPFVNLYGRAEEMAESKGIRRIHVSITDTKKLVMTMAVGED